MTFRIVESKLERTARLLAAQHNIRVHFSPNTLKVTQDTITLPSIPDNASQEFIDALQGYLDMQTGYILFTNVSDITRAKNMPDKQLSEIFTSVEDARIQERMEDLYPGCRQNFHNMLTWMYTKLADRLEKMTPFRKAISMAYLQRRYPDTNMWNSLDEDTKEKATAINDLIASSKLNNPSDSMEVSKKIQEMFPEESKKDQQQREEEEKTQGSQSQGSSKGSQEQGQSQDSMESMISQASKQEAQKASGKQHSFSNDDGYQHDLPATDGYMIYDTSFDSIEDVSMPNLQQGGNYLQKLREDSKETTSVMRKRLINTLRAKERAKWLSGRPEGKLDVRRAYKAIHGISDNVYKTRTDKLKLNTAIALGIDHSGSMHGSQLELAAKAAIVLGDVFAPLNIPFMTYGYSTTTEKGVGNGYNLDQYARWNGLWIRHYKRFEESWKAGSLKLTQAKNMTQENTLDGEAVLYGARALLNRPESRKILFIFNDGAPYPGYGNTGKCQRYLKDIVKQIQAMGIEVICFGIETAEVKHYYPHWVLINSVRDLVKEPLVEIDKLLRKGMTAR